MDVTEPFFNKPVAAVPKREYQHIYEDLYRLLEKTCNMISLVDRKHCFNSCDATVPALCNGSLPGTRQNMESKQTLSVAVWHGAAAVRLVRCCSSVTRRTRL